MDTHMYIYTYLFLRLALNVSPMEFALEAYAKNRKTHTLLKSNLSCTM